ncbi:hypothetical protein ASE14_01490 [Agromyces sp. Root81]|nr:hypothetical protein ASE14_01490 [Agromyces sp. Root81]
MTNRPGSTRDAFERARPFALTLLFGAAAFTITVTGTRAIADIIGPVFLALVITISLHPIRLWLEGTRLPKWAISLVMLVAAYLLIFLLTLALIVSVAQVAALLPQYTDQLDEAVVNAGNALSQLGVEPDQIHAVVDAIDPGQIAALATSLLSGTLGVLTNLVFLITVLFFLVFDTDATRQVLRSLGNRFPNPVAALNNFAASTRNYMGVNTVFGLGVAVVDGVALLILGVPGAFVWAVLAFVTSFIPNVGFIIGVIPPALIALLHGGPGLMIAVIVVYTAVNFLSDSVIKPRVVGDTVGLSTTITFLSLVFWTWVIGPLGALLAVPLTLLTRALLVEADPRTRWALPLISGKPDPVDEPESEPVE